MKVKKLGDLFSEPKMLDGPLIDGWGSKDPEPEDDEEN